ncbi:MAG: Rrf2 family transcriptional regulator [Candidatus Omnitrophica bacterium]|nr:Rrf2 family transcriptional regulator [Candidatus Omnitrophota bacterium]
MRISARCDYACKALLELSLHWPGDAPLQIHTISDRQSIPIRYLVQILIQLKRMGQVSSIRGKDGGYNLAKPPNEITLGEVMRRIGGPLLTASKSVAKRESVFAAIWDEVDGAIAKILDKVTFEDIAERSKGKRGAFAYQI